MNNMNQQQMDQHVKIVGWLYIVGNAVMLLLGCFVFALLMGIGAITDDPTAFKVLGITGAAVGALLVALGIPGIVAGAGLLRRQGWARVLALVIGFLGLLNFPLGTAIGIYAFWVLLQDAATAYFGPCCEESA
jgi:hypothetical protein